MRRFLRDNGLSLVLFVLFIVSLFAGQAVTGWHESNDARQQHGQTEMPFGKYLTSSHFMEATMENWESEFLQMFAFVILTTCLFQRGSAESRDPDNPAEEIDEEPSHRRNDPDAPWPVRKAGRLGLWLYSHSLSLTFLGLFLVSFWFHAVAGAKEYSEDEALHGGKAVTTIEYLGTSRFWFESFQNWQSEFLAVGCMVVFSIWLREWRSPESKPVGAPHSDTGR
jgi:hypothetical protein